MCISYLGWYVKVRGARLYPVFKPLPSLSLLLSSAKRGSCGVISQPLAKGE